MTPDRIETLKKIVDRADRDAREQQGMSIAEASRGNPAGAYFHKGKAIELMEEAATLRDLLALAEQARAMEEVIKITAQRAYIIGYIDADKDIGGGMANSYNQNKPEEVSEVIDTMKEYGDFPEWQALAAANAAMKAGE